MRTLKLSFLFFILLINISAQEGWFWQNPLPQGNNLYNIISINNNMGYACGENGTFIKITNGGLTWTVLSFPNRLTLLNLQFINETIGWVIGSQDSLVTLFETTDD